MHGTPLKKLGLGSLGEIVNSGYPRDDFLFKKNNEAIISE